MAMEPAVVPVPPSDAIYIPIVIIGSYAQANEGHAKAKAKMIEAKVIMVAAAMFPLPVVSTLPLLVVDLDHI
jgi:hypothetical protein